MTVRVRQLVTKTIKSLSDVSAGGINVVDLPLGKTYYDIFLELTGPTWAQVESEIKEVRLVAEGKYIRRLTPEMISHLRTWHGAKNDKGDVATIIHIPAVPQHIIDPNSRDSFAIGTMLKDKSSGETRPLTNFALEVEMGSTVSNITAGKVYARFMEIPSMLAPYYKVDYLTDNADMGEHTIDRITTKQADVGLIAAHIELPGTSTMTKLTVTDDDGDLLNAVSKTMLDMMALEQGFTQGDDYVGIPFTNHNTGQEFLQKSMANLLFKPTFATANPGNFNIITEELVFNQSTPV